MTRFSRLKIDHLIKVIGIRDHSGWIISYYFELKLVKWINIISKNLESKNSSLDERGCYS
ncbi:hypothetical protein PPE03_30880 [Pseudoalteromonas peptidolytica]|nr:hypothetical protein PPE03_30880 [Pseudoalteromonas peptidolytica]